MYSLLFLGLTAFALSLFLTPLVRNVFRRHEPGGIPRVGGIPIAVSYLLAYALLLAVKLKAGYTVWHSIDFALRLLPVVALVFAIGLVDDLRRIEPWHKAVGQIAAACLAWWAGVHIDAFGGFHVGAWSLPLTVLWIVACTAAIKVIDGVDGLAAGIGLFATCTTLVAALLQSNIALALATVPLAGAILGFLRFNFNPATIFLGESGALFVGFLLGCYSILWSQKAATILGMTAPLLVLFVPLLDALLAIVRRFLRHQPLLQNDDGQIYHRLLNRGLTRRKVALILYACSALGAAGSLLVMRTQRPALVVVLFCVVAWIGVQHLGYVEFGVIGRMFMEGAFRRQLCTQLALQNYEARLNAAVTPAECWHVVQEGLREFGFQQAQFSIADTTLEWRSDTPTVAVWQIAVRISDCDFIRLGGAFGGSVRANALAPFTDLLRRSVTARRGMFIAVDRPAAARHAEAGT
jgi:UDP-GlcNAc:undecaprenyl-phosphate GlcNAc-1-phosphate transferase